MRRLALCVLWGCGGAASGSGPSGPPVATEWHTDPQPSTDDDAGPEGTTSGPGDDADAESGMSSGADESSTGSPPPDDGFPVGTWVAREIPSFVSYRGGHKHGRLTHGPADGKIYLLGGDGSNDPDAPGDSGAQEMYRYDFAADAWEVIQAWCREDGGIQPMGPDEVGFPYDTNRGVFWHMPGFNHNHLATYGDLCGIGESWLRTAVLSFDPATLSWTDEGRTAAGTAGVASPGSLRVWNYDPERDVIFAFTDDRVIEYHVATDEYVDEVVSEDGATILGDETVAVDLEGRKVYIVENRYERRLWGYDLDARVMTDLGPVPDSEASYRPDNNCPQCGKEAQVVWDPQNRVALWPLWYGVESDDEYNTYEVEVLYVYRPDRGAWEELPVPPAESGPADHDLTVRGRHTVFDETNNVLIVTAPKGGPTPIKAPHPIFFYRFGNDEPTSSATMR